MKKQYLQILSVLVVFLITCSGFANDSRGELMVVRPDGSWPPWEIAVDGELSGIHIELVQVVAKKLNLSVTFRSYPWKRAIQMLKTGKADAITYMSKSNKREKTGYFFEGNILSKSPIAFFTLKKHKSVVEFSGDLKSLQDYTIGTCRGFSYDDEFDRATYLDKDDGAGTEEQLLMKLRADRLLIAIGHTEDVKYRAKLMGMSDEIVFLHPYLTEGRSQYLVFSKAKSHEALAKLFAVEMEKFKKTSKYRKLLKKYGLE